MKIFTPTYYQESTFDINIANLKTLGIKLAIFDLDNTLASNDKFKPSARVKKIFSLCQQHDIKVMIISNNNKARVKKYCRKLNLFYIAAALKPLGFSFYKIKKHFIDIKPEEMIIIGDQVLTDIAFANTNKVKSILVKPIKVEADAKVTRLNRIIENKILTKLINNKQLKSL